jgi:hypothetical protein
MSRPQLTRIKCDTKYDTTKEEEEHALQISKRDLCLASNTQDGITTPMSKKFKHVHVKPTPTDVLFIRVYVQSTPPGPQHLTLHQ